MSNQHSNAHNNNALFFSPSTYTTSSRHRQYNKSTYNSTLPVLSRPPINTLTHIQSNRPNTSHNNTINRLKNHVSTSTNRVNTRPITASIHTNTWINPSSSSTIRSQLLDTERKQLYMYLSSPNCNLFSHIKSAIRLSEHDLDALLYAGESTHNTMLYLQNINQSKRQCQSFAELIELVQHKHSMTVQEKNEILIHLTSNKCKLFRHTTSVDELQVSVYDIDRLYIDSGCMSNTMQYIHNIEENAPYSCTTFNDLLQALKEQYAITLVNHSKTNYKSMNNIHQRSNARNSSSANLQRATLQDITSQTNNQLNHNQPDMQCGNSIDHVITKPSTHTISSARVHSRHNSSGSTSGTVSKRIIMDSTRRDADRLKLLSYMSGGECELFSDTMEVAATAAQLDEIIQLCNNVDVCITTLTQLDQQSTKCTNVYELIQCVKSHNKLKFKQSEFDRQELLRYLSDSMQCKLFSTANDEVVANEIDLHNILLHGGSLDASIRLLRLLDVQNCKFHTFHELIAHITVMHNNTHTPAITIQRPAMDHNDTNSMLHINTQASTVKQWLMSNECILFVDEFNASTDITSGDIDNLMQSVNAEHILYICKHLNLHLYKLNNMQHLISTVTRTYTKQQRMQSELLLLLNNNICTLLTSHQLTHDTANIAAKINTISNNTLLSASDIEQLILHSTASIDTLILVDKLQRDHKRYKSIYQLAAACKLLYDQQYQQFMQEHVNNRPSDDYNNILKQLLLSKQCRILDDIDTVQCNDKILSKFILSCDNIDNTILYCHILNDQLRRFMNSNELLIALKECHESSEQHKLQLYTYITNEHMNIFTVSQRPSKSETDHLYCMSVAGQYTIEYCKYIVDKQLSRYNNVTDLTSAIKNAQSLYRLNRHELHVFESNAQQLSQQSKYTQISQYLNSSECTLFATTRSSYVQLCDTEIESLLQLCNNNHTELLLLLQHINCTGVQYTSYQTLQNDIQDKIAQLQQINFELLRLIQSNSITSAHSLLIDHRLFIRTLTLQDIHRVGIRSECMDCIKYVRQYISNKSQFNDLQQLIQTIKSDHQLATQSKIYQFNIVSQYCDRSSIHQLCAAGLELHRSDVFELIDVCGNAPHTIYFINQLIQQKRQFSDIKHIIYALKNLQQTDNIINITQLINSDHCTMLQVSDKLYSTDTATILFKSYGNVCYLHLLALHSNQQTFASVDMLSQAIQHSINQLSDTQHIQYICILAHIMSIGILNTNVRLLSQTQINQMTSGATDINTCITIIDQLYKHHKKLYKSIDEFITDYTTYSTSWLTGRAILHNRLSSDQCTLFTDTNSLISHIDYSKLNFHDINGLIELSLNTDLTIELLNELENDKQYFHDMLQLQSAIQSMIKARQLPLTALTQPEINDVAIVDVDIQTQQCSVDCAVTIQPNNTDTLQVNTTPQLDNNTSTTVTDQCASIVDPMKYIDTLFQPPACVVNDTSPTKLDIDQIEHQLDSISNVVEYDNVNMSVHITVEQNNILLTISCIDAMNTMKLTVDPLNTTVDNNNDTTITAQLIDAPSSTRVVLPSSIEHKIDVLIPVQQAKSFPPMTIELPHETHKRRITESNVEIHSPANIQRRTYDVGQMEKQSQVMLQYTQNNQRYTFDERNGKLPTNTAHTAAKAATHISYSGM